MQDMWPGEKSLKCMEFWRKRSTLLFWEKSIWRTKWLSPQDSNEVSTEGILVLSTTSNMKNAGISDFLLNKEFIFKFDNGGMCAATFYRKTDSTSKIMRRIKTTLENRLEEEFATAALLDIENQLIQRHEEIFSHNDKLTYAKSTNQEDNHKLRYLECVTKLKKERQESNFTFEDWQLSVQEKYKKIRAAMEKNFPGAWPMLQFCLAVKSILNIEGCTLPFMGVILAIPSSMKTLVIQLFRKYPHSLYSDNFTPNAFQSHNAALNEEQLRKNDLLPRLHNRLFLTPELAPVFTANEDELRKSLGIITRVLDGHGLETDSGAQGHRRYGNTFFVWVGAAVEIPYRVWTLLGTLGHKIYFFRPDIPEKSVEDLERIAKENDFLDKFEETEKALLEYLVTFDAAPMSSIIRIDDSGLVKVKWDEKKGGEQNQAIECIARVANLLKRLRGIVYISRSKTKPSGYNSKGSSTDNEKPNDKNGEEIQDSNFVTSDESDYDTDYPIVEDPSRAVILLRNLAVGNAISQGRDYIKIDDMPLVVNVALSTTTRARSELIKLLLDYNGQLSTSEIVMKNKVSPPFAKRAMKELAALGIVNTSSVAGYNNSELKITLKDEYKWFMEEDFQKLFNNNQDRKNDSKKNETSGNESNDSDKGQSQTIELAGKSNEENIRPRESKPDSCDPKSSHTSKPNPPPETPAKNIDDNLDSDNSNGTKHNSHIDHNSTENYKDIQLSESKSSNNKELEVTSSYSNTCDCESKPEEKNNDPLWGSNRFQHVTVTWSLVDSSDDFRYTLDKILEVIRGANGSEIAFNFVVESVHSQKERIKTYLGEKLTSRENKKVRNLALEIIRNKNIEVVKHKPQLLVRWNYSEVRYDETVVAL